MQKASVLTKLVPGREQWCSTAVYTKVESICTAGVENVKNKRTAKPISDDPNLHQWRQTGLSGGEAQIIKRQA